MKNCDCGYCQPPAKAKATPITDRLTQYDTGVFTLDGKAICRVTHCQPEVMERILEILKGL